MGDLSLADPNRRASRERTLAERRASEVSAPFHEVEVGSAIHEECPIQRRPNAASEHPAASDLDRRDPNDRDGSGVWARLLPLRRGVAR